MHPLLLAPRSMPHNEPWRISTEAYSPECVEGFSVLKKWLSSLSAAQESPKTRPKRYENVVFGPRTGDTREREGFFNSAPWPLPGHPEAMKMVPSPTLTSALTGAIYLVGESPFNSVTQEPQVHRIVALRARTPDSPERGSSWRREGSTARDRKEKMWKGSSSDAPGSTCTRARSPRA